MQALTFSVPDILLLLGIGQGLYIITYLIFRAGKLSRATIPLFYFLNLTTAFALTFIQNNLQLNDTNVTLPISTLWTLQFPFSVLLIMQVAQIYKTPALRYYSILALAPIAMAAAYMLFQKYGQSCGAGDLCAKPQIWYDLASMITGTICMVILMMSWDIITELTTQKNNKERYWLILALMLTNSALIATTLLQIGLEQPAQEAQIITTLFGLVLLYLAGTSLLRIYPQAVNLAQSATDKKDLSRHEISIAKTIEDLIYVQKVYHEPTYSRSDMARECEVPEGILSKVLNTHFKQSFPQLLNTHRVEDAKRMIAQIEEPMSVIAKEAGFNSLATFNRVFKEISGESPTAYKKKVR